jgi:hypothetical protein
MTGKTIVGVRPAPEWAGIAMVEPVDDHGQRDMALRVASQVFSFAFL